MLGNAALRLRYPPHVGLAPQIPPLVALIHPESYELDVQAVELEIYGFRQTSRNEDGPWIDEGRCRRRLHLLWTSSPSLKTPEIGYREVGRRRGQRDDVEWGSRVFTAPTTSWGARRGVNWRLWGRAVVV
ncbi:hypothetical protein NMY22_g16537 [Coprinellus aureogranulatus]|nr:hypothetical protein NMY22_g16537 [Coprinellus aureogranulatus]